jgi:histone H3/H4
MAEAVPENPATTDTPKPSHSSMSQRTSFKLYLQRVTSNLSPDFGLSAEALDSLDAIMVHLAEAITSRVHAIADDGKTIGAKDVSSVVQLLFPGELSLHANASFTKRLEQCKAATKGWQVASGLVFPFSLAMRHLRQFGRTTLRVSKLAGVCLASSVQYIASEIIELATGMARNDAKKRIKNRHVMLAIHNDAELHQLLIEELKVFLPSTGVMSSIHPFLVQKRAKKRSRAAPEEVAEGQEPTPKKRRFHPGTVSLRNIRKLQKSTELQLRRAPLVRYCRSRAPEKRLSAAFITALQSYVEAKTVELFQAANAIAIHAQRQMLLAKDLDLAMRLQPQLGFLDSAASQDDKLPEILKPGLRRLSLRAGVKFMASAALQRALECVTTLVSRHMAEVNSLAVRDRKRTINGLHLRRALSLHGVCLAINLQSQKRHASPKPQASTPEAPATPADT